MAKKAARKTTKAGKVASKKTARKSTAHAKLKTYRAKRDFKVTAEPSGAHKVEKAPHLRYVIQKHAATRLHYDLRLELDGVFRSWAVTKGPSRNPKDKRLAVEVEDHPLDYGDFEGTIPKGEYGGGTVMLWDRGFWAPQTKDAAKALAKGELKFVLSGDKLNGGFVLVRMNRRDGEKRNNWLLIKHRDEYAIDEAGEDLLEDAKSVASSRTMEEIAAGKGKKPRPFMLNKGAKADAVWHSKKASPQ
ncbi:DNA polymerase ligase N-terminal domain-containing protein [Terricaulis sp.]|uniref:DNA polymerase ligase N-terminal domain-containing protein n=1 Tax=Terricaulis sp. TaxID=2768686 RepID=UPI002AC39359|nr:DNA polymerase ligase N-terminal domain-containing protein [Terricaulis sp.]MDZ4690934.1 DNA polymerase ligase N-terminal domain-containing protein [Terricaulis sp.]